MENKPEKFGWAYFGNEIINPLLKSEKYVNDFHIIDRSISGNILESVAIKDSHPSKAIEDYKNFWFNPNFTFSTETLNLVTCGIISLHNSWTPEQYRLISDETLFLEQDIPMSHLLKHVLVGNKSPTMMSEQLILEGYLSSELNRKNILFKRKYFRNMLVLDFSINKKQFAFDISVTNKKIKVDLVLRNIPSSEVRKSSFLESLNFNVNKVTLGVLDTNKQTLDLILKCYAEFINNNLLTSNELKENKFEVIQFIDDVFIDLENFEIKNNKIYLSGIGFIQNLNVVEWSDIDYKLIFKSKEEKEYIKQLAKLHKPEITQKYAVDSVKYDKCFFTTFQHNGIDVFDIPFGNYDIYLSITVAGVTKKQKLRTIHQSILQHPLIRSSTINNGVFQLDTLTFKADFAKNIVLHNKSKQLITESILDTANNRVTAPKNSTNCFIRFEGSNNHIDIDPDANIRNLYIECLGSHNIVKIGKNVSLHGTIRLGFGCEVNIGDGTSSTNPIYATCAEQTKLLIGRDCMFATNNQIRTDDAHPIYDVNTGKRVNMSKDIQIGDHVWIGYGATILSGSAIGSGSVIGAGSIVRNKFPNNCVIAGTPAKVVKKDIFWERPLLLNMSEEVVYSEEERRQKNYCKNTMETE
ncbi:acyltransferase [Actinobacillus pleuropneumoniae]|uniref:acyltransferase n=1 Tax=Actinobacillus pleuropneumoniae TaxID=715 RepID=UPI001C01B026|nr:acyltransferase [Actinobacillus pleuropneumoniae]MBT9319596.1 acyltransferase [Actinobacillus pleuropneumoniae]MBT9344430.1 acyltransferase [Actinobacillus pleuropneumoniae]